MTPLQKLATGRTELVFKQDFFAHLLMQIKTVELTPEVKIRCPSLAACDTMATDGFKIYFDPDFVMTQSKKAVATVLLHEAYHIILEHAPRVGNRDMTKANIAMDIMVNNHIDQLGSNWEWPVDGNGDSMVIMDHSFDGLSFEAIYDQLPDDYCDEQKAMMGMVVPSGEGDGEESEGQTIESQREEMLGKILTAATIAEKKGSLPASIRELIDMTLNPELDWKEKLRQFAQSQRIEDNYRWQRPHRGIYAASDGEIILPSLDGRGLGDIVVARDSSGSIYYHKELLAQFNAEIESIHGDSKPATTHIIDCDAEVQSHREFSRNASLTDLGTIDGGGGTDFAPVFDYVERYNIKPVCLIYLTDMYGDFPDYEPTYPTLWVSYSDVDEAPFGEVINAKIDDLPGVF